jgi:hypothetical protein
MFIIKWSSLATIFYPDWLLNGKTIQYSDKNTAKYLMFPDIGRPDNGRSLYSVNKYGDILRRHF